MERHRPTTWGRLAAALAVAALAACEPRSAGDAGADSGAAVAPATGAQNAAAAAELLDYTPPPDSLIPDDPLGRSVRRGRALFVATADSLPEYAPGNIRCASCHLDAGRRPDAAAVIGVVARYPKYMTRSGAVVPIHDRVNYCFTRSMAGTALPADSREMADIIAYLSWLSKGLPQGVEVKGTTFPRMPELRGDSARGAALYATTCVTCHGAEGAGQPPLIPALWGPGSYAIGASMARERQAASFIRHFMPQTAPGTLTDQQAYDLAAYVNSHPRPDSPGKADDWPAGGAPPDVPYDTKGHAAYRPPSRLLPRANPEGAIVPAPRSVKGGAQE